MSPLGPFRKFDEVISNHVQHYYYPSAGAAAVAGNPAALIAAAIATMGWSLAQGAVGAPTPLQAVRQAKFSVSGTYGAYGALQIQGSADGVNWSTLGGVNSDGSGYSARASAAGELVVLPLGGGKLVIALTDCSAGEPVKYLRPVVQNGDGTTALSVVGQLSNLGAV